MAALDKTAEKNFLPMQPGDVPATYADTTELDGWSASNQTLQCERVWRVSLPGIRHITAVSAALDLRRIWLSHNALTLAPSRG